MIVIVKKLIRDSRGNALLEFALVFPLYLGMILGMINIAVLLNNDIVAASAARESGRVTAVTGSAEAGVRKGLDILANGGLAGHDGDVNVTRPGIGVGRITSTVEYRVPTLVPGLGYLLGGSLWESQTILKESSSYYVEYRHRSEIDQPSPACVGCGCRGGCW